MNKVAFCDSGHRRYNFCLIFKKFYMVVYSWTNYNILSTYFVDKSVAHLFNVYIEDRQWSAKSSGTTDIFS